MICADWIEVARGVDPAARWRGAYHSEAEYRAILKEGGGLVRMMDGALADIGIARAQTATRGAVGVIKLPHLVNGKAITVRSCAIHVNDSRWAFLTLDLGVMITKAEAVAVWRV